MIIVLLLGIMGVMSIIFGAMILAYGGRTVSTKWFFIAMMSNGLWEIGLSVFLTLTPSISLDPLPIVQFYYIAAALIPVTMIMLVWSLTAKLPNAMLQIFIFVPWILLSILIILTPDLFLDDIYFLNGQYIVSLSNTYVLYVIVFIAYYIAGIVFLLINKSKEQNNMRKAQFNSILSAYGVYGVVGMTFNLLLPGMGNYSLIWIGPLGTLAFIPMIYISIVKQGLFDVRVAVTRTIAYMLTLALLTGVYILSVYSVSLVFFGGHVTEGVGLNPINIIIALAIAFMFQPIKTFFDKVTDKLFFRSDYDREEFFRQFGKIISYDTDLNALLKQSGSYIAETFKAERVFFHIRNRGIFGVGVASRLRRDIPEADIKIVEDYYRENHDASEVIITDNVTSESVRKILASYKAQLALPLMIQGETIGCLFIGEHKSRGFRARDVQAIESVANELTIAVQNSMSVEEIRDLNESLQYKVDTATRELRASNRQLQKLDETKNEFISMASHQLRTPLTSIKGYLDMVLQGDLGKVTATQRAVLSEAFVSSERMVALINDFLNISRLQTGKFSLERAESDLVTVVREELQMMSVMASQRNLKLKEKISKNIPLLSIDADKLRQVVVNMVDNAIYYSKPETIIRVELVREGDEVVFRVKDTGIGVPKSEQPGLFSKFFRASNARKKRPDGTGVGLFLAKKVITLHGGQTIFESAENKGSTFGFRLPVK